MILKVVFPVEVVMPTDTNTIVCNALYGMSLDLTCSYNATNRTLKVMNGFTF